MIEYNATISPQGPNPPNSIVGQAVMRAGNFSSGFICFDPRQSQSGWSGSCYSLMAKSDPNGLSQTDSVTISISISLLYANVSRENATGVNCENLRLHALTSANNLAVSDNSTSESFVPATVAELDQKYAKVK